MPNPALTFQKFNDQELAETIAARLQEQGIPNRIVQEGPVFDPTFANNGFEPTIHLKIAPADFDKANNVLESYYQSQLAGLDPDYYLFAFTNEELQEIIRKKDEWGQLDLALAKKLLQERGQPVKRELEDEFRRYRMNTLAKPEKSHPGWIILGYIAAVAGGILGFLMGYILACLKKTLPDGKQVYVYSERERIHGKWILVMSAIFFPLWLLIRFFDEINLHVLRHL